MASAVVLPGETSATLPIVRGVKLGEFATICPVVRSVQLEDFARVFPAVADVQLGELDSVFPGPTDVQLGELDKERAAPAAQLEDVASVRLVGVRALSADQVDEVVRGLPCLTVVAAAVVAPLDVKRVLHCAAHFASASF